MRRLQSAALWTGFFRGVRTVAGDVSLTSAAAVTTAPCYSSVAILSGRPSPRSTISLPFGPTNTNAPASAICSTFHRSALSGRPDLALTGVKLAMLAVRVRAWDGASLPKLSSSS